MKNKVYKKLAGLVRKIYFYRKEYCCFIDKDHWNYEFTIPDELTISHGKISDINKFKEIEPRMFGEKKIERFRRRLIDGDNLLIVRMEGEVAGYGWISTNTLKLGIGDSIQLKSTDGAIYDVHTFKEYRGRRVYQSHLYLAAHLLMDEGRTRIYSNYDSKNAVSHRVFNKMGFKVYSVNGFIRLIGFEHKWIR